METTTGAVDDWFESASYASSPRTSDNAIAPTMGSVTFRRSLFQPINDTVEHRPPIRPLIPTEDVRLTTPRMSESGIFARSPDPKIHRPSSTRNTPSPTAKKHQTESVAQSANTLSSTGDHQ